MAEVCQNRGRGWARGYRQRKYMLLIIEVLYYCCGKSRVLNNTDPVLRFANSDPAPTRPNPLSKKQQKIIYWPQKTFIFKTLRKVKQHLKRFIQVFFL